MNREQLGAFIAENRKAAGWTQRELAERLHVTDKAVSKWERALSYPDVTLLEPLAEVFGLGVGELMACQRREETEVKEMKREEQSVEALLEISRENLRKDRRKNLRRIAAAALLTLAAVLAAVWYQGAYVSEAREDVIILKETAGGSNYIYVEQEGHLIRLKCGSGVDFENLLLTDEWGEEIIYRMDCRWNRRTREGTVSACKSTDCIILGSVMDTVTEVESTPLFWYDEVSYNSRQYYPDPYGEPQGHVYLCDCWFWLRSWDEEAQEWKDAEVVLKVEDCIGAVVRDIDQDGRNEVVVRTRWPEKPYKIYDWEGQDKEITVTWLEDLSPELIEQMMVPKERQGELEVCLGIDLP